jgi:hypothetical protein
MHPLVDAFWKGRAVLKRTSGVYIDDIDKPKKSDTIGAIAYGLFSKSKNPVIRLKEEWPQISYWAAVPCEHDTEGTIIAILIHLNDVHSKEWTDKKIADWLELVFAGKAYPSKEDFDKTMQ